MSSIPFIEARFFNPDEGRYELETRFKRHLRKLRCREIPPYLLAPIHDGEDVDERSDPDLSDIIAISADDEARIKRMVRRILELRKAASGLEHLKRDDRERLESLKDPLRMTRSKYFSINFNKRVGFVAV